METLEWLWHGLTTVLQPQNLLFNVIGVALGILFGAIPGLTATLAIALLLPFTFGMDPLPAMLMLLGIFSGTMYSSSVTAITINTPGNPASAVMVLDGYPLGQQGKAGKAIGMACISSSIGSFLSVIVMTFMAPLIASFALRFSPVEYFAVGLFGLTAVMGIAGRSVLRGVIATGLGVLLSTVGMDAIMPYPRFTMGQSALQTGIPFLPAVIGLFAIAEVLRLAGAGDALDKTVRTIGKTLPSWSEFTGVLKEIFRGSAIGMLIGILPGAGGTMASFLAYSETRRASKNPEKFGKGELAGVASPDAASNSLTGGSMIPMLSLGIPGDAVTAVLLGALVVQGVQPGPALFTTQPDLVYSIFVGMALAAFMMLILGLSSIRLVASIVKIPRHYLLPFIAIFSFVGAFAESGMMYDVWIAIAFGVLGFFMNRYDFPVAPIVLGLILGPIIESAFRRSLTLSDGNWLVFINRPISATLLAMAVLVVVFSVRRTRKAAARRLDPKIEDSP